MPRDAARTRSRILAAAISEFAEHGLAGGRIDRITAAAAVNPRSVYAYFANKEALFHAAVYEVLRDLAVQVPLTSDDLPGFAGRMFDWVQDHPEAVRLNNWRLLEAPAAGPDDHAYYVRAVRSMTSPRPKGAASIPPADLLILVTSMASAWASTPADLRTAGGRAVDSRRRIARHRAALVAAVERLCR